MTKAQMVKHIRERLQNELNYPKDELPSKKMLHDILDLEADEINAVMATNDSFQYPWGTIKGIEVAPTRVGGFMKYNRTVQRNHGWSQYKKGIPKIVWSEAAKLCDNYPPEYYFNMVEHRYTSAARLFRQDAGFPEIPEFEGLSEEKIQEINKKADEIEFNKLSKKQQYQKLKDAKTNYWKIKGSHKLWEEVDYETMGILDDDFKGRRVDLIDKYLRVVLESIKDRPLNEQLNELRNVKDLAVFLYVDENHPEIDEKIEALVKECADNNIPEIEHIPFRGEDSEYVNPLKAKKGRVSRAQYMRERQAKAEAAIAEARENLIKDMMDRLDVKDEKDIEQFKKKLEEE